MNPNIYIVRVGVKPHLYAAIENTETKQEIHVLKSQRIPGGYHMLNASALKSLRELCETLNETSRPEVMEEAMLCAMA